MTVYPELIYLRLNLFITQNYFSFKCKNLNLYTFVMGVKGTEYISLGTNHSV